MGRQHRLKNGGYVAVRNLNSTEITQGLTQHELLERENKLFKDWKSKWKNLREHVNELRRYGRDILGKDALFKQLQITASDVLLKQIEPLKVSIEEQLLGVEQQLKLLPPLIEKEQAKAVLQNLIQKIQKEFVIQFRASKEQNIHYYLKFVFENFVSQTSRARPIFCQR
eukprot:UN04991